MLGRARGRGGHLILPDFGQFEDRNGNDAYDDISNTAVSSENHVCEMIPADVKQLLADLSKLYLSPEYSDIVFIVEGERIPALKSVLAVRNDYFKAMLFGNLIESRRDEIELPDTPSLPFKHLLKYLYTGEIEFNGLSVESIIQMIQISQKFCFPETLVNTIAEKLRNILAVDNVIKVFEETKPYCLDSLSAACLKFIDIHADAIVKHESFYHYASLPLLKEILLRDSFCADESEIFQAVHAWINFNKEALKDIDAEEIIDSVRLPLIIGLDRVVQNGHLDGHWDLAYNLSYRLRALELPDVDLCGSQFEWSLLDAERFNYKLSVTGSQRSNTPIFQGWGRFKSKEHLTLKLEKQSKINHIRMLLPARKTTFANEPTWVSNHPFRPYSYIIQVSVDNENWDTIISSHSEPIIDLPTSMPTIWQIWYFKPVIAKFIRIIDGEIKNRDYNWFYLLSFECYYSSKSFDFDQNGVIIPHFNIASIPFQPQFCCQEMTFLSDCDLDTKYKTYLKLMSNSYRLVQRITINLQQQCVIDSIKFLLYDRDTKSYRYYVELSPDGCDKNFRVVIERNNDWYTSWQLIKFTSQVVKSIRIYCTSNKTAHSMYYTSFRLVHFECPASDFIESSNDS